MSLSSAEIRLADIANVLQGNWIMDPGPMKIVCVHGGIMFGMELLAYTANYCFFSSFFLFTISQYKIKIDKSFFCNECSIYYK